MSVSSPRFCTNCGAANTATAAFCFACGQAIAQFQADTVSNGDLLKDRYRILNTLGQGGMGSVYKAEDTLFGNRVVAMKEMSQNNLNAQQRQEAANDFKREAHILAGLHHPNLPTIYDYFSDQGQWYLVMDFVAGETLEDRLADVTNGWLPLPEALEVGRQLCAVLNYLHLCQPPIIFRDLKPANIMCTPSGDYFLIDFGIARHFKPGQFKDTVAFGSLGYAAPEQYGKTQTTPRSDIYSLGVILHQCLTGHDPTTNSPTPFDFPPLDLHGQTAPGDLFTLISRMLMTDQNKRPAEMATVLAELEQIIAQVKENVRLLARSQSTTAITRPASSVSKVKPPQPNVFDVGPRMPTRSTSPVASTKATPKPKPRMGSTKSIAPFYDIITALACTTRAPYLATGTSQGQVQVWKWNEAPDIQLLRTLPGSISTISTIAWSSDGTCLAAGDEQGLLTVWEVATGRRLYSYRGYSIAINSLAWSPNGIRIAMGDSHGRVMLQNAYNGEGASIYSGHLYSGNSPRSVRSVGWSPTGKHIASGDSAGDIRLWEVEQPDKVMVYSGHKAPITRLCYTPDGSHIASADTQGYIHLWNTTTGDLVALSQAQKDVITALTWSPDGQLLASAGRDEHIQIWAAFAGTQYTFYREHSELITALGWHPGGQHLISASADRTARIWKIDLNTLT